MPIKLEVLSPGHVEAVQVTLNGPHTQFDVSEVRTARLHIQPQSHFQFIRRGDDLLLQMHDGAESILLIDYFEDEDDIPELQFLSADQSCFVSISFVSYQHDGVLIPEIGQTACSNEGFAVPPLLLLGLLGAGVAAAAVIADDDDGGSGGPNPPPGEKPDAPVVSAITEDRGKPGDGVTNDDTLIFSGSAIPGAIVLVYLNGDEIGSTIAGEDGAWSYDHTAVPLDDGIYQVTAAQKLSANGPLSDLSEPFRVEIDTNDGDPDPLPSPPPVIDYIADDTGHDPNDGVTRDTTLFIGGTAKPHATVFLYEGENLIGTAIADAQGAWEVDNTGTSLSDGTYILTARQEDLAGNPVSPPSEPFELVIDTNDGGNKPTPAPIVTGISDDNGESDSDGITDDNTLEFHGIGEAGALVFVYLGTKEIGSTIAAEDGSWTYDHTGTKLPDGEYLVTAEQIDAAGNQLSPRSEAFVVVVDTNKEGEEPTPAPAITGITEDDGHDPNDGITRDDRLFIHGTGEPNAIVTVSMDGKVIGEVQVNAQGEWDLDHTGTAIPEGTYDLTATQRDLAGNDESDASDPFTITIDTNGGGSRPTQPPAVTGITKDSGIPDDGVTNDNTLEFHGTSEPNALVFVRLNGRPIGTTIADADGNWTYDHTSVVLPDGPHVVTASQQDAAGNPVSDLSEPFDIFIDSAATGPVPPPRIDGITEDTGHSDSDGVTKDKELLIHGLGRPNALIIVHVDGKEVGSVMADGQGAWTYDHTGTSLDEGPHVIEAQQRDLAGNELSDKSTPFDVVIDTNNDGTNPTLPPEITAITEDTGVPDGVTKDDTLLFHGTAEPNALVEIFIDGMRKGEVISDADGNWTYDHTATPLAEGPHSVTARQRDQAGNDFSDHSEVFEVVIDTNDGGATPTPPPEITGITEDTGEEDGVTKDNTLIFHGTGEPHATVEVFLGNLPIGTAVADDAGVWELSYEHETIPDGAYSVTATQRDLADNDASAPSDPFDLVVDTNNGGNTPTNPPIVDGINTDDGREPDDGITSDNTITVYGRSDEPDGAVVTVTISTPGGSVVATLTAVVQGGTWETEPTQPLDDGDYDVSATQRDLADNDPSFPSVPMPIIIDTNENGTVPTAPPVVEGIEPDTGDPDGETSESELIFFGTGERHAMVTVYLDGAPIGTVIADENGNWEYDHRHTQIPEGTYQVTATQQDAVLHPPSDHSQAFELTIDQSPIGPPTGAMDAGLDVALFAEEPLDIQLEDDGGDIDFPLEEVQREAAPADESGYEFHHASTDSSANQALEISRLSEI